MNEWFSITYILNLTLLVFSTSFLILRCFNAKLIEKRDLLILLLLGILTNAIFVLSLYKEAPCVDSDGWYDVYTAYRLYRGDHSYFDLHYKYGYGYVFTLALFLNFLDVKSLLPTISIISLNLVLIFTFLSLILLTGSRIASLLGTVMVASNHIILRYTFLFMGKEIFLSSFTTLLIFFFISFFSLKRREEKIISLFGSVYIIAFLISIKAEYLFLLLLPVIMMFLGRKTFKPFKKDVVALLVLSAIISIPSFLFVHRLYVSSIFAMGGNLRMQGKISFKGYVVENVGHFLHEFLISFYYFPTIIFLGFKKFDTRFLTLLLSFVLIIFPYLIYYPWFFQMRYLVPTISLITILMVYSLYIFFKNPKLFFTSLFFLSFLFFTMSFLLIEKSLHSNYCEHQDFSFYKKLIDRFGKGAIYLAPRTNQQMILLTLGADADSFEMIQKYVREGVYFQFYVKGNKTCEKGYPFKLDFNRSVYFIPDFICQAKGSIENYLCDCILTAYKTECFEFEDRTVCKIKG